MVSDGALTQAVRSLRRALGDSSREPAFVRTVSRHGYQFVFADVDRAAGRRAPSTRPRPAAPCRAAPAPRRDPYEDALSRLLVTEPVAAGEEGEAERREAAEALHALGTEEALRRLDQRPGHASARALLRDTRWDVPGAGLVPLLGAPGGLVAARILVHMRLRRALRLAGRRWTGASAGGAIAGLAGARSEASPSCWPRDPSASASVIVPLALVGALVGGLGAAGVGAGLAMAEALARSLRGLALVALGALGGADGRLRGARARPLDAGRALRPGPVDGGRRAGRSRTRRRRRSRLRAGDAAAGRRNGRSARGRAGDGRARGRPVLRAGRRSPSPGPAARWPGPAST